MKKNTFIIILLLVGFFSMLNAQEKEIEKKNTTFKLSGEIRPRAENLQNPAIGTSQKSFATQRSRLNFDYSMPKVKTGLVLQDVRSWGNQKQLVKNEAASSSIHQAWAEVELFKDFTVKAGRMELAYDNHRILGSVGWAQQARSHDIAVFKYEKNIKAHFGFAFHGNRYQQMDAYRDMQFLWLNGKAMSDALTWSFLVLSNGKYKEEQEVDGSYKTEKSVYSFTAGPHLIYKKNKINAAFNFYYQTGNNPGGSWITGATESKDQVIAAYDIGLDIGYTLDENAVAGLGIEHLSGNDFTDLNNTDQNAFTPFYGTNHKFNGWMDYFYVGNHGGNIGLTDIYGKFIVKNGDFFIKIIPHYFMPAGKSKYIDASGNSKDIKSLGAEIDLWAGYHIVPKIASIQFGYSLMLPTESMLALKGTSLNTKSGISNWAWVMLVVKPQFLNHSE